MTPPQLASGTGTTPVKSCVFGSLPPEIVNGLPAAFVALIIGLIAGWIAYQQWKVARAKLNLDLFERRLEIYKATDKYLLESLSGGPQGLIARIEGFDEAEFLFGPEVKKYLHHVHRVRDELRAIDTRAKANNNMVPPDDVGLHAELTRWLTDQRVGPCKEVFAKYLDFGAWH